MKILIVILSLIFVVTCYAENIDKPRILIRKVDNQIVGVGYTNFEGISNLQDYIVKEIEPAEIETYNQQIKDYTKAEFQKAITKEAIAQQQREAEAKQALNLTDEQFNKLKEALKK